MATFILKNCYLELGGTTFTDHTVSVALTHEGETQDETAMGDNSRSYLGGLKNWSAEIEFLQDFAAGSVDATINALVGTSGAFYCRPTTAAVGATNPSYSGVVIVTSYPPISGTVGDVAKASVSCLGKGDLTRGTTA